MTWLLLKSPFLSVIQIQSCWFHLIPLLQPQLYEKQIPRLQSRHILALFVSCIYQKFAVMLLCWQQLSSPHNPLKPPLSNKQGGFVSMLNPVFQIYYSFVIRRLIPFIIYPPYLSEIFQSHCDLYCYISLQNIIFFASAWMNFVITWVCCWIPKF